MADVVELEISRSEPGERFVTEVERGESLMDVADRCGAPLALSCRASNCASCMVTVLEGGALLSPVADDERRVLDLFTGPPEGRLACQLRVTGDSGRVRLRLLPAARPAPVAGLHALR